ncbi:MAG: hypothetical protein RLZZ366_1517, partial [Pseudomonadota bacterium]
MRIEMAFAQTDALWCYLDQFIII